MQSHSPTTPFGRRSLALAHVASQMVATARPPEKVVHKWKIYQAICAARPRLGVSERSLSVLNALLTFHPETALTGEEDLIVFPSNHLLSLRAHGMPASTLRRHLAVLVDAGLDRSTRQPERQTLRAKGWHRRDRARVRFRSVATGRSLRRVREPGGTLSKPRRAP